MTTIDTDILIVGGGIAGAALACALRNSGYYVVVVDQRKGPLDKARGDHLQPCNVEALARWGVLEKFFERGARKRIGHEFRTAAGEVLLSAEYNELPIPYPYFLVFNHDLIADLCMKLARENANFLRLQPVTARNFKVGDDGIESLTVELPGGEGAVIKPHVVIGADGLNSVVRATMGFAAEEHQYRHPMVALFGTRPAALQPADYLFRYSGKHGVIFIQPRMDGSLKATLPIGQEGIPFWKKSTKEERAQVLSERAAVLEEFDSEIAGFYSVKMMHCREYVKGNVVLIGDAAHTIHPARGQGLNMGIQCLPKLVDCLPPPAKIANRAMVQAGLQHYQFYQKPLYDRIIARNHEAVLAMEASTETGTAEFIRRQDEQIRNIHCRPEMRRLHLLEATGYPFGIPAAKEIDLQA